MALPDTILSRRLYHCFDIAPRTKGLPATAAERLIWRRTTSARQLIHAATSAVHTFSLLLLISMHLTAGSLAQAKYCCRSDITCHTTGLTKFAAGLWAQEN